jgi:hypothetical protein
MSTNLATILVGLGYDLSALEKGAPEAFRLINQQTLGMSAEMKRASREGAESFRLIDEALGIHLSRPLTRLLTQEFPGLAKGLQSILGVGVVGALGVAGVELFDKIAKGIEKAQKAQEALKASTENVNKVFAEEMAAYQNKDKAITAATSAVDRLADAEQKQAKAAQEASGWFSQTMAAVGDWLHKASSFQSTLNLEEINSELGKFKEKFDTAALTDSFSKTHTAAVLLQQEISKVSSEYDAMQQKAAAGPEVTMSPTPYGAAVNYSGPRISAQELSAEKTLLDGLTKLQQVETTTAAAVRNQEAQAEALRRQAEAAKDLESLYRSIGESMKKLQPETDPLKKLSEEIQLLRYTAEKDFSDLGRNSDDALQLKAARAALASYETNLDRVFAKAKADAAVAKAATDLPTKITAGTAPQFAAPSVSPTLGAGGSIGEQFDTFLKDQNAQLKLAADAYQDVITPADKFRLVQQELDAILKNADGSFKDATNGAAVYAAALQKAQEEMVKTDNQLQKMLEKGGVSGGFQAFMMQIRGDAGKGSGQFVFDTLNKGLQGFEDETVKALTGAKTSWASFFESLDQMALKFVLNGLISQFLKGFSGSGLFSSISSLFGGGGGGGGSSLADFASGSGGNIAGFASGTDYAPGGLSWVGENGPELMNVPAGASITPASMTRGHTVNAQITIDARGGEIGVEEKISRALSAAAPQMIMRAVVEASELQRRTPR